MSCKALFLIILRECYIDVKFITYSMSENLLFKSGDKCVGAQSQRIVFTLAAFKGNAVVKAFKVNCCKVAVLTGSVFNVYNSCISFSYIVKLFFHFLIGNLNRFLNGLNALIFSNLNFGLCCNNSLKCEAFIICFCNFNFRLINRLKTCFFNSLFVCCRIEIIYGILAISSFNHGTRCLAFSKSGQSNLLRVFYKGSVNCLNPLFALNFNYNFTAIGFNNL